MNAPCLDCGEPMVIVMRDEQVLTVEPETIVGYSITPARWRSRARPRFQVSEHEPLPVGRARSPVARV
jgi:hypothetical protein